jgi:rRNA maturation RNase YbeY
MYQVEVFIEPHYPVKRALLRNVATIALESVGAQGKIALTVSVIGDRKMKKLNKQYRGVENTTDVLSFSLAEGKKQFVNPPDFKILNLGDVVISYPQALLQAAEDNVLVEERLADLLVHGVLHLLGHDHQKPQESVVMAQVQREIVKKVKEHLPEVVG